MLKFGTKCKKDKHLSSKRVHRANMYLNNILNCIRLKAFKYVQLESPICKIEYIYASFKIQMITKPLIFKI